MRKRVTDDRARPWPPPKTARIAVREGRMTKPHGRLVSVSSTRCRAYTSDLSTSSSSTALQGACAPGDLVLRFASRLDAFSGYRIRTLLPSDATGVTTGTQAVRPTRSSRTKVRSSQVSSRPQQIGTKLSHDVLNPARVPL